MRKLLVAIILLLAYLYITGSGQESVIFEKGKQCVEWVVSWLKEADLDFHMKKEDKKRLKRWR